MARPTSPWAVGQGEDGGQSRLPVLGSPRPPGWPRPSPRGPPRPSPPRPPDLREAQLDAALLEGAGELLQLLQVTGLLGVGGWLQAFGGLRVREVRVGQRGAGHGLVGWAGGRDAGRRTRMGLINGCAVPLPSLPPCLPSSFCPQVLPAPHWAVTSQSDCVGPLAAGTLQIPSQPASSQEEQAGSWAAGSFPGAGGHDSISSPTGSQGPALLRIAGEPRVPLRRMGQSPLLCLSHGLVGKTWLKNAISLNTKALKQAVGAGKLATQVADPLSKTLGPDLFWNSGTSHILQSLQGAYMM